MRERARGRRPVRAPRAFAKQQAIAYAGEIVAFARSQVPDRSPVEQVLRDWAAEERARHPQPVRLGYFGSYARGDWGVGSDLDVLVIVQDSALPFQARAADWAFERLPVSTDLLVDTEREWDDLRRSGSRFAATLANEVIWVAP